jgi:hypothetical protein
MAQSSVGYSTSHLEPDYRDPSDFKVGQDLIEYVTEYAREKPEVAALWCFGIGFILGWKLKPW